MELKTQKSVSLLMTFHLNFIREQTLQIHQRACSSLETTPRRRGRKDGPRERMGRRGREKGKEEEKEA